LSRSISQRKSFFLRRDELEPSIVVDRLTVQAKSLQARIVSGSVVQLSGSGLVTAINLAYNIIVARYLGPGGFGHATVVYTLLTLLSAVTLAFQMASTKVIAQQRTPEGKAAAYRSFHRSSWTCGLVVACTMLLFQGSIADYLNLPDPILVALIAIGAAFYIPLGTRRGYFQGTCEFRRLAINLVLEGAARLGGSYILILLGFGVRGVTAANAAAVAITYLAIPPRLAPRAEIPFRFSQALRETSHALFFFSSQVLINNCDIVLVKHFFSAKAAGLYAAVTMVGRVIFAFSSAVVNTTFPLVAGTREEERKDLRVIATSFLLVMCIGSVMSLALWITPAAVWTSLFGSGFAISGTYTLPYLMTLYALKTVVYSLSVVIITFEMSYKIANTSWVHLAFSGVLMASICRFHSSLYEVIMVQLELMVVLLVLVASPFLIESLTSPKDRSQVVSCRPIRLIRRVAEDEVIAEFLKSDFHCPAFQGFQETLNGIVINPNLDDADENAKRRALLFIRHLALWNELPTDTEWYEAEIGELDLGQIRTFPRAQWRKVARGDFSVTAVAEGMRTRQLALDASFLSKVEAIGNRLEHEEPGFGAVILIGLNENEPLTVLDGNHRLVAAVLSSPERLSRLRFMCGLSPRMSECCWYNTNFVTLFRYGRNVLTQARRDPGAELARLLQNAG
jgi:O-antigen/teichoic acid export membrane protein